MLSYSPVQPFLGIQTGTTSVSSSKPSAKRVTRGTSTSQRFSFKTLLPLNWNTVATSSHNKVLSLGFSHHGVSAGSTPTNVHNTTFTTVAQQQFRSCSCHTRARAVHKKKTRATSRGTLQRHRKTACHQCVSSPCTGRGKVRTRRRVQVFFVFWLSKRSKLAQTRNARLLSELTTPRHEREIELVGWVKLRQQQWDTHEARCRTPTDSTTVAKVAAIEYESAGDVVLCLHLPG